LWEAVLEVEEDGLRSGVEAGLGELLAQLEDLCHHFGRNLLRGALGTPGSRFERGVAALAVAGKELKQPAAGDPVPTRQPGRAAPLQHHRLDQVTRSSYPGTSLRKESRMSCDISPGSGEITHPPVGSKSRDAAPRGCCRVRARQADRTVPGGHRDRVGELIKLNIDDLVEHGRDRFLKIEG